MLFGRDDKREPGRPTLTVPLLPLRDIIVFPHMVVPLFVGREKSIAALKDAMAHKGADDKAIILLAAQKKAKTNDPAAEDIFHFGTLGHVIQLLPLPDGTVKVLVEGVRRARSSTKFQSPTTPFFMVRGGGGRGGRRRRPWSSRRWCARVHSVFEAFVKLNKRIPPEMLMQVASIDDPARLADTIVAHLSLKLNDKQALLETESPAKRLEKLYELMQGEIEILQVEKKIRTRVKKQMEKTQKEYYLNEQMQAIQKELGERDEFKNEIQEIEEKLKTKRMSKEATLKVKKELKKLRMMSPMSAEATVVRNYIDWILSLPWYEETKDRLDVDRGRARPRRGPLRAQEGQGAHPRVPRGAGAGAEAEGAHPVLRGPAGRRARPRWRAVDRPGHGPQVRAPVARRRARRGGDPRPPPHVHRRDARQAHPVAEEGGVATTRSSCSTRSTRCPPTSAATRRRRCWRCWTRSRTTPSTTTTSTSTTTCRR